jgi:hypothetical protein
MRATIAMTLVASILLLAFSPQLRTLRADSHGDCDCKGCPEIGIIDIGGRAYVDDQGGMAANGYWVYLESNGAAGLQRGGSSVLVPGDHEICWDDSDVGPDTLLL